MISTTDPSELEKFERLADSWWDPRGPLRTLHAINPVRVAFIQQAVTLPGKEVLDLGCGGGLLSEALAGLGARVTGIDASESCIQTARSHQRDIPVDYRVATAEALLEEGQHSFDIITCMEMLEHIPDAAGLVQTAARLLRPGGEMFLSTINRTPRAYLAAILGAEYLLGLLPRGTHTYARFIRPSELCNWLRRAAMEPVTIRGMYYLPYVNRAGLTDDPSVNYLVHARLNA